MPDDSCETLVYSLRRKNSVMKKCEESQMPLIHRLWLEEQRFALMCSHCETTAIFTWSCIFLLWLESHFTVHL